MAYRGAGRGDYMMRDKGRLVTASGQFLMGHVSTADIAAGGSGEVTLADADWNPTTIVMSDVVNDWPGKLKVGTKCYLIKIGQKWRIFNAVPVVYADIIEFTIGAIVGMNQATVTVDDHNGGTLAEVPEMVDGEVTVFDNIGCFFNEDNAALMGRKGYAAQMSVGDWSVISLCCPPVE